MTNRTPIIGGNWKMNTDLESGISLASEVADAVKSCNGCDVVIYPPFPYLQAVYGVISQTNLILGAQNMWFEENGAYTGEISAQMLQDMSVKSVLVGHSERRHILGESDALIAKKVESAIKNGFQTILCLGESFDQREAGNTLDVVLSQLRSGLELVDKDAMHNVVVAYEPVWAIGTGKTATPNDAQTVHKAIRDSIEELFDSSTSQQTRIQYGGSVKPDNATELFACEDIDGALVGGSSLSPDSFTAIVMAVCNG